MLNFEGSSPVAEDIEGPSSAAEEIAFATITVFTESHQRQHQTLNMMCLSTIMKKASRMHLPTFSTTTPIIKSSRSCSTLRQYNMVTAFNSKSKKLLIEGSRSFLTIRQYNIVRAFNSKSNKLLIEGPSSASKESAFAKITGFTESQSKTTSDTKYDVFINHRGKDVKNTLASLIYHNLHNKKLKVFLDNKAIEHGDSIQLKIQQAISTASVHIAIFSENYADSVWCLSELCLMEESGAPIIPIFCGVQPSDLRMKGENKDKQYSKALDKLSQRVDRETIEKWRATLLRVSYKYGFQFEGDHGRLLEDIAVCVAEHIHTKHQSEATGQGTCNTGYYVQPRNLAIEGSSPVAEDIEGPSPAAEEIAFAKITGFTESQSKTTSDTEYDVFINHRGKDVKNTLASLLYHNLNNKKLKVFLDNKAMQHGDSIQLKIQQAISTASVHIAIFSENYAESVWCLSELCLMEESRAPIIPIFCGVQPSDLRMKDENEDRRYSKALDKLSQTVDRDSIEKWRATLLRVSYKYGFQFEGDHGRLLEDIAVCVVKHIHTKHQSEVMRLIFGIFFNACWIFLGLLFYFYFCKRLL